MFLKTLFVNHYKKIHEAHLKADKCFRQIKEEMESISNNNEYTNIQNLLYSQSNYFEYRLFEYYILSQHSNSISKIYGYIVKMNNINDVWKRSINYKKGE